MLCASMVYTVDALPYLQLSLLIHRHCYLCICMYIFPDLQLEKRYFNLRFIFQA